MKKLLLLTLIGYVFLSVSVQTQSINLNFTGQDSITMDTIALDSVMVYNITSNCDTVVYGPSPSLLLVYPTGLKEYYQYGNKPLVILPPFPNPAHGNAQFILILKEPGLVKLNMYNILGEVLVENQMNLKQGKHSFKIESSENKILFIRASTASYSSTIKLINISHGSSASRISYLGYSHGVFKSGSTSGGFIFNPGDQLSYTAMKSGYHEKTIYDYPMHDTTYTFLMNIISPPGDGWYIMGTSTAYHELNENAMMHIARNEVTQIPDTNLYELYIPVMTAYEGFNIVEVSGTDMTTYGPDTDFLTVTNGAPDEPLVPFQRGSYIEDINPFMVPEDGMYHVAIYLLTQKVVVVPVHWGMIGTATNIGWSSSVPMNESAFDLFTMSWTIDSIDLYYGVWKYRYSDGWKVFLDTTVNLGNGLFGISVNTNLGESVDSLVPGGSNFVNNDPGIYTSTMEYTLGSGYLASLTLIDTLSITNWTGVVCDAVGTGISPDNPAAVPDPSAWNWGYRILADNGGVPGVAGNMFTWTWTSVILEAYEGFKLRTLDGLPSPINNMYFDAGYLDVNVLASSPEIIDGGPPNHNIMATVKENYTIILHIDAANNNQREIIITMD